MRPKFVSQICKNFSTETEFKPRKALILSKVSRYDYEKSIHKELSESALRSALLRRGSDPDLMRKHHSVHFEAEQRIVRAFKRHGIECKVCKRDGYTDDKVIQVYIYYTLLSSEEVMCSTEVKVLQK